jgi:hypothetical protein
MRITYQDAQQRPGKTSEDVDEVEVRLTKSKLGEIIEQEVVLESDDHAFAGTIRMVWTFHREGEMTLVTVRAENVPAGISSGDHEV